MHRTKIINGFEFIKLGDVYLSDTPLKATHNGNTFDWYLSLKATDDRLLDAGESAYLVYFDDELVYIGEYSTTFAKRWLREKKYLWHSDTIDNNAKEAVLQGKQVTVWITKDPYVTTTCGREFNVSKVIEHQLLSMAPPVFNKRNSGKKRPAHAIRVTELF